MLFYVSCLLQTVYSRLVRLEIGSPTPAKCGSAGWRERERNLFTSCEYSALEACRVTTERTRLDHRNDKYV